MAKCSRCKKRFSTRLLRHVTDKVFWFALCPPCYLWWKKETGLQ